MWVRQLIGVCAIVAAVHCYQDPPVVQTAEGTLRGKVVDSYTGKKILSFVGVRFAESPTGVNRFKPPVPVRPWTGVKDAIEDGPLCPRPGAQGINTSEDCLFLNVHTKSISGQRPVIVYFHSGGFAAGTGNSFYNGPQYFLDQDIVLVTFNYRLGPLGFLSTGDGVLPGNYGMRDQLAVLKWVKRNIAAFGGDPGAVTLYGYSAGGGSVQLHMVSPLSRGLFHRVIASSCSALTPAVLNRDPLTLARRFARLLNCSTETSEQIRDCLQGLPEADITAARTGIRDTLLPPTSLFAPVIEKDGGEDRFLPEDPVEAVKAGRFTQVPLIAGITRDEFSWRSQFVVSNSTYLKRLNSEFDQIAPWEYHYPREPQSLSKRISNCIKHFYFHDLPVTNSSEKQLGELYVDSIIVFSVVQMAKLIADKSSAPVYFYKFSFEGRFSYNYILGTQTPYGVVHHDDLIYLFYNAARFPLFNQTDPEAYMVRTLTSVYSAFAKYGTPTLPTTQTTWTPMTSNHQCHMEFTNKLTKKEGLPYPQRVEFWEKLLPIDGPYRLIFY